ncbi:MAG: hypothetical protein HYT93_00135 [Parcubacteria group bacterium]|nr:hypothetical protein [Parcubacteria group bacterium]
MKFQSEKNIIIFLVIISGIFFLYNKNIPEFFVGTPLGPQLSNIGNSREDLQIKRDHWKSRINEIGPESAYSEFLQTYNHMNFEKQHTFAHIMGELLYEKVGVNGLAICDKSFAFGCFHGFFTGAISKEGIGVIAKLDNACLKKFGPYGTGCQHGIGHGILEHVGPDSLVKGLEACRFTTQIESSHFGCTSGVFMEYNTQTIFTRDNVYQKVRDLKEQNPFEPCNTLVPSKFKNSCYFEISAWWMQVFNKDHIKVGQLCQMIQGEEYRKSCYLGFGTVSAHLAQYNVSDAIKICKETSGGNIEAELLCRASASWSFWAMPGHKQESLALCDNFEDEEVEFRCVSESDLIGTGEKFNK